MLYISRSGLTWQAEFVVCIVFTFLLVKPNHAIRQLRKITGQTQAEFAAMVGVSKDAVASWEIGRSNLSPAFARRIACATGVDGRWLLAGLEALRTGPVFDDAKRFTAEAFQHYRKTVWGRSDEEGARQHLKRCVDALSLIFLAAAKPGADGGRGRLPGVLDAFMQWCEQTREDFQLGPQIEAQLEQRRYPIGVTFTYREWRQLAQEDPAKVAALGFQDDPTKAGHEALRLEGEGRPGWKPGYSMKWPRPANTEVVVRRQGTTSGRPPGAAAASSPA
jgi:transcriptional regulator with XRE-family HTH domain